MTEPDWSDATLPHRLTVTLLDPVTREPVGTLGVSEDGCEVTESMDAATRASARVTVPDWGEYRDGAWVRIDHTVDGTDWSETLFTGFVWTEGAAYRDGTLRAEPELVSALKALETCQLAWPYALDAGAWASAGCAAMCDAAMQPYRVEPTFVDHLFGEASVWDVGETHLDVLADLCALQGDDYDVTGDGTVRLLKRPDPAAVDPSFSLDCDAPGTPVLAAGLEVSTQRHQTINRAIVTYAGDDGDIWCGYSDADDATAAARRGYIVSETFDLDDAPDPCTALGLQRLAAERLEEARDGTGDEWSVRALWLPVHAGDVGTFAPPGGAPRRVQVREAVKTAGTWRVDLTLREV